MNAPSLPSRAGGGQPTLSKEEYVDLRSRLDFSPNLLPTLAIVVLDAGLLAAAALLIERGGGVPFLVSQLLLAVVFFNSFSILHECGHGSASRSPLFNTLLGHYASIFCFIPYYPWKYIHQKHHTWTGNLERDPVLKSIRTFRDRGVPRLVRFSWWSWIPVAAALQHVVFLTYPLVMARQGELTPGRRLRCLASVIWPPLVYLGLWRLMPALFRPANFALALVIFLVAEELVNLPHHVGMPTFTEKLPVWEQYLATRSCYYPRGLSELLVLNFNFHIEHHLFPSLPWYRLRRARDLTKATLQRSYSECLGVSWNVRHRTRDFDSLLAPYRSAKPSEPT